MDTLSQERIDEAVAGLAERWKWEVEQTKALQQRIHDLEGEVASKSEQLEQIIDKSSVIFFSICHKLEGGGCSEGETDSRGE